MEYLYVLFAVECRKLKKEAVEKNFKKFQIDYPQHNWSFEKFKEFEEELYGYPIDININREEIAFFLDEEEAKEAARANILDYNDGGCFNYGLVEKVPLKAGYPYYSEENEFWLFKYDHETHSYKDEDFDSDELTRSIKICYNIFAKVH